MSKQGDDMDFLSATLIRKYREGTLSPEESARLARLCAENPFYADAWEGMMAASSGEAFEKDVNTLRKQVAQRVGQPRGSAQIFWRVAAAVTFMVLSGGLLYFYVLAPGVPERVSSYQQLPDKNYNEVLAKPDTITRVPAISPLALADVHNSGKLATGNIPYKKIQPVPVPESPVIQEVADEEEITLPVSGNKEAELFISKEDSKVKSAQQGAASFTMPATRQKQEAGYASDDMPNRKTIQGRVYDADDQMPLPGVNVLAKNTAIGTITNVNGQFLLQVPDSVKQLAVSSIGYVPQEVDVMQQDSVHVQLVPDVAALSEVVVVGYGSQEKKAVSDEVTSARPAGGMKSFKDYVQDDLRYPEDARAQGVEGVVKVAFTVAPDGSLSHFIVKKSLGYGCDEEAIRLIKESPPWQPATENGIAVEQQVVVKVKFKL